MIALIQLTKTSPSALSTDDYPEYDFGDDAALFSYDEVEDRIDDSPKPIYDLKKAQELFKDFEKKFQKKYKNEKDRLEHYNYFVESLKEINRINSDKEYSSTSDINLFSDFSPSERQSLLGVSF